jgi:hypothetical protein
MNNNFILKLISEEIADTLFFATGSRVFKTRNNGVVSLLASDITVDLVSHTKIIVNGKKFKHSSIVKHYIQLITN